jgi:hypothetical protein
VTVERFEHDPHYGSGGMKPDSDGEWVRYEDYCSLIERLKVAEEKAWMYDELCK